MNLTITDKEGVSCESCHGPGSLYKSMTVMKNLDQAKAKGLIMPDENVCKKCHNSESPTYKEFKLDEMWKKIAHNHPKAG